jgi:poly-gamma-glutamate capsule biosynthesis protein CapA/YwtB (metallophosphatase superfamily)
MVASPDFRPSRMQRIKAISPSPIRQRAVLVGCLIVFILAAACISASDYLPSASLVFLGDIMLGRGVAQAHEGGDWESVLQSLAPITRAADLALANLESPIRCTPEVPSGVRSLAAPPASSAALISAGMDIVSTANNHALDAGPAGRDCTVAALSGSGISMLESYSHPLEINLHGLKIVFLAINLVGEMPLESIAMLERAVHIAHRAGKIVVVSLHWGLEYQSGRDALQEQIAARLADAGADVLWGHHPHVVQETEWRNGSLILYSLGNAVFDQQEPASSRRGALVWAEVGRSGVHSMMIIRFAIDPRLGKTGAPDLSSFRFSSPQSPAARDIITQTPGRP